MDEDQVMMVSPEPGVVRMDEVSQASNLERPGSSKNGVVDKDNNVITVPPVIDESNCDTMEDVNRVSSSRRSHSPGLSAQQQSSSNQPQKMFTLKRWNAVSMWSWDVECDTCAICRFVISNRY